MDEIEKYKKIASELKYDHKKQQSIIEYLMADALEAEDEALKLRIQCAELGEALVEAIGWNWLDVESAFESLYFEGKEPIPESMLIEQCEIIAHALNNSGYWRVLK